MDCFLSRIHHTFGLLALTSLCVTYAMYTCTIVCHIRHVSDTLCYVSHTAICIHVTYATLIRHVYRAYVTCIHIALSLSLSLALFGYIRCIKCRIVSDVCVSHVRAIHMTSYIAPPLHT